MADQSIRHDAIPVNPVSELAAASSPSWIRHSTSATASVGVADGVVATGGSVRTSGLGSCVAVCLLDADASVGGLIHPMLPAPEHDPTMEPGRYVTSSIADLIDHAIDAGAERTRLEATIVGGATMLQFSSTEEPIGTRNVSTAESVLSSAGIPIRNRAVGGSNGRSVVCDIDEGSVSIRQAGSDAN